MDDTGGLVQFDEALNALAREQRRELLFALLEQNPQSDAPVVIDGPESVIEEAELSMRHQHLPKLEEYGLIQWDKETNEVKEGPKFVEIRPLLELLHNHEDELPESWL